MQPSRLAPSLFWIAVILPLLTFATGARSVGISEVAVERDSLLNERMWGLIQALHEDDFEKFCAFAHEPVNGDIQSFDAERYETMRKALRPYSRKGFTVQPQPTARPINSTNHWYRAWVATLPSKSGRIAGTCSIIVIFRVDQPGRPISNIAINPHRGSGRKLPGTQVDDERRFEPRP